MDSSLSLGAALLTAIVMGLGCGAGCGSLSTPFMITKILGDQKDVKQSFLSLLSFTFGKVLTMIILGVLTSMIGREVISLVARILPFDMNLFFGAACIIFGFSLILKKLKRNRCGSCRNHNKRSALWYEPSYFLSGALLAIIPCVPLVSVLVYASAINTFSAALLLAVFGLANSLTPLFLYAPLTGFALSRMKKEIPEHLGKLQYIAAILLIILGGGMFFS